MMVPSGMVTSVTNSACGQVGVAVGAGVFVLVGSGVKVSVAGALLARVGVAVVFSNASTVWAA